MKLNTLLDNEFNKEELLEEKVKVSKEEIFRPMGVDEEEFTPKYKRELELVRDNNPKLWNKIKNGL